MRYFIMQVMTIFVLSVPMLAKAEVTQKEITVSCHKMGQVSRFPIVQVLQDTKILLGCPEYAVLNDNYANQILRLQTVGAGFCWYNENVSCKLEDFQTALKK